MRNLLLFFSLASLVLAGCQFSGDETPPTAAILSPVSDTVTVQLLTAFTLPPNPAVSALGMAVAVGAGVQKHSHPIEGVKAGATLLWSNYPNSTGARLGDTSVLYPRGFIVYQHAEGLTLVVGQPFRVALSRARHLLPVQRRSGAGLRVAHAPV